MWTPGLLAALWAIQIPLIALHVLQGALNLIIILVQHGYHSIPYA